MSPQIHKTSGGLTVLEIFNRFDLPHNPRDFDVEGTLIDVTRELHLDAKENDCPRYIVNESDTSLWQVWRAKEA